jgi:hypothetical protein
MPRARVIGKLPLPFRERGKTMSYNNCGTNKRSFLEMPIADFDCFPESLLSLHQLKDLLIAWNFLKSALRRYC